MLPCKQKYFHWMQIYRGALKYKHFQEITLFSTIWTESAKVYFRIYKTTLKGMLEVTNTTIKIGIGNWDNQHKDEKKYMATHICSS